MKRLPPDERGQAVGRHLPLPRGDHRARRLASENLPGELLASINALPQKNASLEKTAYLKAKGAPGFIEFVPNRSMFNHPETVSLQATISFY